MEKATGNNYTIFLKTHKNSQKKNLWRAMIGHDIFFK